MMLKIKFYLLCVLHIFFENSVYYQRQFPVGKVGKPIVIFHFGHIPVGRKNKLLQIKNHHGAVPKRFPTWEGLLSSLCDSLGSCVRCGLTKNHGNISKMMRIV